MDLTITNNKIVLPITASGGITLPIAVQPSIVLKVNEMHKHAISDVNGLQEALDGKSSSAHTHSISDITGLQAELIKLKKLAGGAY